MFVSLFEEVDGEYIDLVYHTTDRWLSRAKIIQRFIALKYKISKFLQTKPRAFHELGDSPWNDNPFSLCAITSN